MTNLPQQWHAYADLQTQLASRARCDLVAHGLEAALNRLLEPASCNELTVTKTIASASRRERHRSILRATFLRDETSSDAQADLVARDSLRRLRNAVTPANWRLLNGIGLGHNYEALVCHENVNAAALRIRVLRLRTQMQQYSLAA